MVIEWISFDNGFPMRREYVADPPLIGEQRFAADARKSRMRSVEDCRAKVSGIVAR
jgi:hypothetical protein